MTRLLFVVATTLLLAACAINPKANFYTLQGGAEAASPPTPAQVRAQPLSLALGPIDLPEYLDRPQIVSRDGQNRLKVDEFNRWGGNLEEEIHRVLAGRLGEALGTERIYRYPSRIVAQTEFRVAFDIRVLDGVVGGQVQLDAAWSLIDEASAEVREVRRSRYAEDAVAPDYAGYAAAMSALIVRLADEVALSIQRQKEKPAAMRRAN